MYLAIIRLVLWGSPLLVAMTDGSYSKLPGLILERLHLPFIGKCLLLTLHTRSHVLREIFVLFV
jgi:hypothetical protein